jgi:predicted O-methyltransferase YrrM
MAWALLKDNNEVDSVMFELPAVIDSQLRAVEVSDHRVTEVLLGKINLHQCLATDAELLQAAEVVTVQQKYWSRRYPAMMGEADVDALANLSKLIPKDGVAVETGSRLGGSSKIILDHAPDIKRLYCIDVEWSLPESPGIKDPYMDQICEYWHIDRNTSCFKYASDMLSSYGNARLLAMSSPYELGWWTEQIDFIFEDSGHANPQLRDNLDFWIPLVKSKGIIAGHDYNNKAWPDVIAEVHRIRDELGATLNVNGSIWWMIKP